MEVQTGSPYLRRALVRTRPPPLDLISTLLRVTHRTMGPIINTVGSLAESAALRSEESSQTNVFICNLAFFDTATMQTQYNVFKGMTAMN